MAELDTPSFEFGIQNTMEMGLGSPELLNDLMSPETITGDSDKLEEIIAVLPGMKSPTVMPLAQEGWSSVHTVLDEKRFWEIIGKLKALGAEGILVLPIEKMIL